MESITLKWHGVWFDAEVEFEPHVQGHYSGPPENCYPSEGGWATVNKLVLNGQDVSFLLQYEEVAEELDDTAYRMCEEWLENAKYDAAIARSEDREYA